MLKRIEDKKRKQMAIQNEHNYLKEKKLYITIMILAKILYMFKRTTATKKQQKNVYLKRKY